LGADESPAIPLVFIRPGRIKAAFSRFTFDRNRRAAISALEE
jgi:hypothetical protein